MNCPVCAGTATVEMAPGYFRCESQLTDRGVAVGYDGRPVEFGTTRTCGNTWQVAATISQLCHCGTGAVGVCRDCGGWFCGDHSALQGDGVRRCDGCAATKAAEERAKQQEQAEQRRQEINARMGRAPEVIPEMAARAANALTMKGFRPLNEIKYKAGQTRVEVVEAKPPRRMLVGPRRTARVVEVRMEDAFSYLKAWVILLVRRAETRMVTEPDPNSTSNQTLTGSVTKWWTYAIYLGPDGKVWESQYWLSDYEERGVFGGRPGVNLWAGVQILPDVVKNYLPQVNSEALQLSDALEQIIEEVTGSRT